MSKRKTVGQEQAATQRAVPPAAGHPDPTSDPYWGRGGQYLIRDGARVPLAGSAGPPAHQPTSENSENTDAQRTHPTA
jgi:hypothetical protein